MQNFGDERRSLGTRHEVEEFLKRKRSIQAPIKRSCVEVEH